MDLKRIAFVVAALGGLIGIYMALDALVVSDEEELEAIAEDFSGTITNERVERALTHFDPDVHPIEVNARGIARVYGAGSASDLRRDAMRGLSALMGDTPRKLRGGVSVEENRGQIRMHLVTAQGTANVEMRLEREGERWLVSRFQVTR